MDGQSVSFMLNYGVVIIDVLIKLTVVLIALGVCYAGVNFIQGRDDRLESIREKWTPEAQAIYRGLTWVGMCILVGNVVSSHI